MKWFNCSIVFILLFCCGAQAQPEPSALTAFQGAMVDQLDKKSRSGLSELYCWDHVDGPLKTLHMQQIDQMLRCKYVASEPLPPENYDGAIQGDHGEVYSPNLTLNAVLLLHMYDPEVEKNCTFRLPVGTDSKGRCRVACLYMSSPLATHPIYTITVHSQIFPEETSFDGLISWERDGEKKHKAVKGRGLLKESIEADKLTGCVVTRKGDAGWVKLYIDKDGAAVFKSGKKFDGKAIVYSAAKK